MKDIDEICNNMLPNGPKWRCVPPSFLTATVRLSDNEWTQRSYFKRRKFMKHGSLSASQLATIDLMITRAQEQGKGSQVMLSHVTEELVGLADVHHPGFDISEHDQQIINQMRQLAGQIQHSISLGELVELRARIVQGLKGRTQQAHGDGA